MSITEKPDPAIGALYVANLVAEAEAARIEGLSEAELLAEMRRDGDEPPPPMSIDDLLEGVKVRAAQQGRAVASEPVAVPEAPAAPMPAAVPGRPAKAVTPDVPVPKGVVVPIRRSRGLVWGTAAAFAAALAGVFAITEPALVSSFHRPTPHEKAESIRDEAIGSCARGSLLTCRQLLDDAQRLDPGGESEERVRKAREAIEKGVYPGPVVPEGPGR